MSNSLELDQVPYAYVERAGDADEHVDANVSRSCLDLPEIGAARARHKREPPLRDAAARALSAYSGADGPPCRGAINVSKDKRVIVKMLFIRGDR